MIISREVDINVNRYGLRVVIPVVQYDSGRQIIFNIVDAELPSGCTSNIFIRKPSGKSVYNSCTVSGNKVTVTLTNQSLSEYGFNDAQIQIIKGEEVVTSFSFILEVKQSDADNAVISKSESTFFQGIVNKAQAAATTAEKVLDSIPDDYSQMSTKVNTNTTAIATLNSNLAKNMENRSLLSGKSLLDKTIEPGIYYVILATDTPSGVGGAGFLEVQSRTTYNSTIRRIVYTPYGNEATYVNYTSASTGEYLGWSRQPTRSEIDTLNSNLIAPNNRTTIPNDSDINTYTTPGVYAVMSDASASTITNMPRNASGKLIVMVRGNNTVYLQQRYIPTASAYIEYVRNYNNGTWTVWEQLPTRAEVDANKTAIAANKTAITTNTAAITEAIDAIKTDLLGGYKLVGYTASVAMPSAGEYTIPYPNGESFGTVYGILSATFLLGGYCLPYPPLTPSKSPSFDIKEAVSMRITSSGIILNTGGGWGAESRDIYFVLICKA